MLSKPQIAFIRALHQKKTRMEEGLFLVEGEKLVQECLLSGWKIHQFVHTEAISSSLLTSASKVLKNADLLLVSDAIMERLTALHSASPVLAVVGQKIPRAESGIDTEQLILALDDIKDPGNLGTILRIADWFGIQQVVVSKGSVDLYNPKTVQATMGSLFRIAVFENDLTTFFTELKDSIPIYGALLEGENIYTSTLQPKGVIVMGNESNGIRKSLQGFISHALTIPRFGNAESLNVAVATAIICSEFRRR